MKQVHVVLGQVADRRIALRFENRRLEDLLIEGDAPAIGTILRARAVRALKGQGAWVMETSEGPAWLKDGRGLSQGDMVLVQVSGQPGAAKALPVTRSLTFRSRHAVLTPDRPGHNISREIRDPSQRAALEAVMAEAGEMGLILRSAAAEADPEDVVEDIRALRQVAEALLADAGRGADRLLDGDDPHERAWIDWSDANAVESGAEALSASGALELIDGLLGPEVRLPGGAVAWIETVTAFTAVDLDTGTDLSPAAGLKANLALADELPRQLLLRGIGGQIVVDPAPMPRKERVGFEQRLQRNLRAGGVGTDLVGWTGLGHVELSRKRNRVPLAEALKGRTVEATG